MPISDVVARFYGQLTGQRVEQFPVEFGYDDSVWILSEPSADMRKQYPVEWCVLTEQGTRDDGSTWTLWDLLPDPAGEPWEWVKVLVTKGWVVSINEAQVTITRPEIGACFEADAAEDQALEAALAAAIVKMAEDQP